MKGQHQVAIYRFVDTRKMLRNAERRLSRYRPCQHSTNWYLTIKQHSISVRSLHEDTQCAYNVTLRCVCESLLPWKSNKDDIFACVCSRGSGRVCVCSLAYPASNAHAPYCTIMCGFSGSTTFYIIAETARFSKKKKLLNI